MRVMGKGVAGELEGDTNAHSSLYRIADVRLDMGLARLIAEAR